MRSGVVLDGAAMELLEKNAIVPSLLDLRNLVGRFLSHVVRIDALRNSHNL